MKKQYPYSNDIKFLSKIDNLRIKEQWVRIILLEYNSEKPLENIEGKIISGNINKNGDSVVRRTCSLNCSVDAFKYNPDDIKASYSISKKIYLEFGITNDTNDYPNEKIIWFPQGVFFITSFAISASANGSVNISLQFKDKMAQLDGTIGGVLPATVRFDTVTTIVDGVVVTNKTLVYDIIMETVNHFGGEDLSNIIIDDIPKKAKRIIRWMGSEPVWIYPIVGTNNEISYDICFDSDLDEKQSAHTPPLDSNGHPIGAKEYKTNQDIGYMYEDFVYDEELTFNAGSKVTDVLDKIKNWLGNYEYFYDEQGQFHFQEIKNYLNNSQSNYIWDKIIKTDDLDYLYEPIHKKEVYTFDDNINLISITNTPRYENIKNDFIVEGTTNINNIKHTCRYHLVIDDKPTITTDGYDNILMYTDPISKNTVLAKPIIIEPQNVDGKQTWLLPDFAEDGKIYGLFDEPQEYTFKQSVNDMNDFSYFYNSLVDQESALIVRDAHHISEYDENALTEIKDYLFSSLEDYLEYTDDTSYKELYRDVIFSLIRQIRRYTNDKKDASSVVITYYESLYSQFESDIENYGTLIKDKIKWCGELLQSLYDLFNNIGNNPSTQYSDYIDSTYWPGISSTVSRLWDSISPVDDNDMMRKLQRAHCHELISELQIKQTQLKILVEQYTQIINNYNILIAPYTRRIESNDVAQSEKGALIAARDKLILTRNLVQSQCDNYKEQSRVCDEKRTILYAILTALGTPYSSNDNVYYTKDVVISVLVTSFWYYDTDNNKDTYGWNELEWYQYYGGSNSSMGYVDYSNLDWRKIEFDDENNIPSMNCDSQWYQTQYIKYAQDYDLPFFNSDSENNNYVPVNWRTELLLRGLRAEENGTDPGHYYQELKANWPTIYDFKTEQPLSSSTSYINYFVANTGVILGDEYQFDIKDFMNDAAVNPEEDDTTKAKFISEEAKIQNYILNYENDFYYYFFDMIDSSSPTWGEYSVKNIGRRTNVNINDDINCIFAPDIPNYAFINISNLTIPQKQEALLELKNVAEDVIQVTDVFNKNFATGGFKHSAYEQIRYDLQQYTSYQNTLSVTAIPCFYLEPNVRVKINDHTTNTFGDYVIKTISIPLGIGNMSVTMSKSIERI